MNKLSGMKAGAEVRICMVKTLDELPEVDDELRKIEFSLQEVNENGKYVDLDGWSE